MTGTVRLFDINQVWCMSNGSKTWHNRSSRCGFVPHTVVRVWAPPKIVDNLLNKPRSAVTEPDVAALLGTTAPLSGGQARFDGWRREMVEWNKRVWHTWQ